MIQAERLKELDREMSRLPQVEIEPRHYFGGGFYVREILIPAGTVLTGKTHATSHISIMLSGEMDILTPDGWKRIEAPFMHFGGPGSKRLGYAYTDSRWITVHKTQSEDLRCIEQEEFEGDDCSVFDFVTGKVMDEFRIDHAKSDYPRVLAEYGIPHEIAKAQAENIEDRIDIDIAAIGLEVKPSPIEGLGLFALRSFIKGDTIGPGRIGANRTQLGRYINHSCYPNATVSLAQKGNINLVAISNINPFEEITVDYRDSLNLAIRIASEEKTCLE